MEEVLRLAPDRLICQNLGGKLASQSDGLITPRIIELRDFAGYGGRGIMVEDDSETEVRTWMIDERTGQKLELVRSRNVFGYRHRGARILPGVPGEH